MKKAIQNWEQKAEGYFVNKESNYVVREIGRTEREEWVILDDKGLMISCEWKDNKESCMDEADFIVQQEKKYGYFRFD